MWHFWLIQLLELTLTEGLFQLIQPPITINLIIIFIVIYIVVFQSLIKHFVKLCFVDFLTENKYTFYKAHA